MTDEQLAALVASRDDSGSDRAAVKDAFDELFERHARKLLAFLASRARRSDLDDVHQEIWQRVWQSLPASFKGGSFRAWLHQIARNHLIDVSRRKRADQLNEEVQFSDPACRPPDELMLEAERMQVLQGCLQRLGDKLAGLVKARLNGDDYDAICERLSIAPSQVYKLFHQAKSQLATCVERALP